MSTGVKIQAPSSVSGYDYCSAAPEENTTLLAGKSGVLSRLFVQNKSGSTVYVFLREKDASGAQLFPPIPVASHAAVNVSEAMGIAPFAEGLFIGASSTDDTYTATGTADLWIGAKYARKI